MSPNGKFRILLFSSSSFYRSNGGLETAASTSSTIADVARRPPNAAAALSLRLLHLHRRVEYRNRVQLLIAGQQSTELCKLIKPMKTTCYKPNTNKININNF